MASGETKGECDGEGRGSRTVLGFTETPDLVYHLLGDAEGLEHMQASGEMTADPRIADF